LDFTRFAGIPMFTTGRKVDAFLLDHLTAMNYSLFRGYIALFIIPDFLTPNIHYSFLFKPRYSLFIIQLPPPRLTCFSVAKSRYYTTHDLPFNALKKTTGRLLAIYLHLKSTPIANKAFEPLRQTALSERKIF